MPAWSILAEPVCIYIPAAGAIRALILPKYVGFGGTSFKLRYRGPLIQERAFGWESRSLNRCPALRRFAAA